MPLKLDGPLAQELMIRQARDAQQPVESQGMSPTLLAILGAGADSASTYNFLKRGGASEDNAMFGGLNGSPLATALSVAGSSLAGIGVSKLIGKKFPKLADALIANQGARSIGLAGENFSAPTRRFSESSNNLYDGKVGAAVVNDPTRFIK